MAIKAGALTGMVGKATKKWTKQKKAEERNYNAYLNRRASMTSSRRTVKDAAYEIMETAYLKASSNGTLPASARQIMYAARGYILDNSDTESLDSNYFRQLLKDYIQDHGLEDEWDVTFDDRGTLHEPHTGKKIPVGTLQVRSYLEKVVANQLKMDMNAVQAKPPLGIVGNMPKFTDVMYPTVGPRNRFSAIMLVEKEGFMPLFDKVKLAERYDIAILANKGQSVDATRRLVDTLCDADVGVPLFIVRDFDVAGFSISATVRNDTQHYVFENSVDATDLGLKLEDIEDLERESVFVNGAWWSVKSRLAENGATDDEIDFLIPQEKMQRKGTWGERVELNAFTSGDFIDWIEGKLEEYDVKKVIPDASVLDEAFRRAYELECYQALLKEHREEIEEKAMEIEVPEKLVKKIRKKLKKHPAWPWDKALNKIVKKLP